MRLRDLKDKLVGLHNKVESQKEGIEEVIEYLKGIQNGHVVKYNVLDLDYIVSKLEKLL